MDVTHKFCPQSWGLIPGGGVPALSLNLWPLPFLLSNHNKLLMSNCKKTFFSHTCFPESTMSFQWGWRPHRVGCVSHGWGLLTLEAVLRTPRSAATGPPRTQGQDPSSRAPCICYLIPNSPENLQTFQLATSFRFTLWCQNVRVNCSSALAPWPTQKPSIRLASCSRCSLTETVLGQTPPQLITLAEVIWYVN